MRAQDMLSQRQFDKSEVRDILDELPYEDLVRILGEPLVSTHYAEPVGYWKVGDGKPALADDDPAVMQAIGRCAAYRIRGKMAKDMSDRLPGSIHPATCGWCEFPLKDLLAACDWATWQARYCVSSIAMWRKSEEPEDRLVVYTRQLATTHYQNAKHATFWGMDREQREYLIQRAMEGSREGLQAASGEVN